MPMNKLVKVSDLFTIKYGNSLELINLVQCKSTDKNSVPFVSRTENNNGISAFVEEELDVDKNPAHTLTVAVGGSVLSTFYQPLPFYTGFHVLVLEPKKEISVVEMLFYAKCISSNKYKYNYGRQANRTLKNILIPSQIPEELKNKLTNYHKELEESISQKSLIDRKLKLEIDKWKEFEIKDIFKLEKCKCSNATELLEDGDDIFYTGAKKDNNGIMRKVEYDKDLASKGNCVVFIGDGQGSIGYSLYQPKDFIGSTTLTCGYNKSLNSYVGMFLVTILDQERFKYSFGRKYGKSQLEKNKIKLPTKNNQPDWEFMENYIKTLSYSSSL
ncbi:MAG TPA: restriction endonuclease subunit S [Patescibacteria group bacterium]|nr:restriction endonuclease subunit S [Patescibacteria group bacterium]